jgi:peptidoglycan/xylan/chitin deacetylase (PgdA/CDA1 family)
MTSASAAFLATRPFAFFDYFRVPYEVDDSSASGMGCVRPLPGNDRCLRWFPSGAERRRGGRTRRFELAGMGLAGSVVPDHVVRRELDADGGAHGWRAAEAVSSADGDRLGSVWRHKDGSVLLPFDPGDVMTTLWSERYREADRSGLGVAGHRLAVRGYYLLRPALPRAVQLRLRRAFTRVQSQASFPAWPVEDGLHDFYTWLFGVLEELAGWPVPWLDLWPDGRSWALVLTHDVETDVGLRRRELLRGPERQLGLRSSWNLVAERYVVDDDVVRALAAEGCEIGVHGLHHDGKDLGSRRLLRRRLPAMRQAAARWEAVGFRSPATQRRWEWMPSMGFAYDTSFPDTDPYEPQPGGCCTVLPFFNDDMVELPITLPQDHTLFVLLGQRDCRLWREKVRHVRERGGMALVLTHPDYAADTTVADAYRELIGSVHADPTLWHALPREVAEWWRRRATSFLHRGPDGWRVDGPAAGEGRVRFGAPSGRCAPTPAPRAPAFCDRGLTTLHHPMVRTRGRWPAPPRRRRDRPRPTGGRRRA